MAFGIEYFLMSSQFGSSCPAQTSCHTPSRLAQMYAAPPHECRLPAANPEVSILATLAVNWQSSSGSALLESTMPAMNCLKSSGAPSSLATSAALATMMPAASSWSYSMSSASGFADVGDDVAPPL